jgi:4-hydroxy-tetrahydrodipicolinate synthase
MLQLRGSIAALPTPFRDGQIDIPALRALVQKHLAAGTNGLVPCGTTGEAPTLSPEEWELVVGTTVTEVAGRIPVIAGTGGNATAGSITRTRKAKDLGADAALVVTPYYNKPTQEGLYRHFQAVAAEGGLPVVLYNVPGRTGVNLLPETVERLAGVDGIVAVKEASGSVDQISEVVARVAGRLAVLSGDDSLNLPVAAVGGVGAISVLANVLPAEVSGMFADLAAGRWVEARQTHLRFLGLAKALFLESNPIPVKTALTLLGEMTAELRLPLSPMSEPNRVKLEACLRGLGLIDA